MFLVCTCAYSSPLYRRWSSKYSPGSIWYQVLQRDRPKDAESVWLYLRLTDRTRVIGALRYYTEGELLKDQEIALSGEGLEYGPPNGDYMPVGKEWDFLTVRGDRVAVMAGVYLDAKKRLLLRRSGEEIGPIPPSQ